MRSRHSIPHEHLILDACCVINLAATAYTAEIMAALGIHVAIATYVQEQELLSVGGSIRSLETQSVIADLQILERSGLLTYESPLGEAETVAYINFAADLGDDGEAVTCAIAAARGWAVATDDRKAINFLRRTAPDIPVVTTLEIIKYWSEQASSSAAKLPMVLHNIRAYGRYTPPQSHRLYAWWMTNMGADPPGS